MNLIATFFAGAFLCNGIPHLSSGLMGKPFPSPFAKPMGIGDSPPIVNFLWGFFNLLVGISLLSRFPVAVGFNSGFVTLAAGVSLMGANLSIHFGKVQRNKSAK
jgi:hypothetical protein